VVSTQEVGGTRPKTERDLAQADPGFACSDDAGEGVEQRFVDVRGNRLPIEFRQESPVGDARFEPVAGLPQCMIQMTVPSVGRTADVRRVDAADHALRSCLGGA